MSKQASNRHHYLPCFYTGLWVGIDGRLCQYSRPRSIVTPLRRFPKQVGFSYGLYGLTGVAPEHHAYLEDKFFKSVDNNAARAVKRILDNKTTNLSNELRAGFAQFITSFFHRTPDRIYAIRENLKNKFEELIVESRDDPANSYLPEALNHFSLAEIEDQVRRDVAGRGWGLSVMNVIDSKLVNTAIMRMAWTVCEFDRTRGTLLTSDKPLVRTNGFVQPGGHLSIALGPRRLFIATNDKATLENILGVGQDNLITRFNDEVVSQAHQYVFGENDSQLSFVERRLARKPLPEA